MISRRGFRSSRSVPLPVKWQLMYRSLPELLRIAHVNHALFSNSSGSQVFITDGNQLVGTYNALKKFRASRPEYRGWDVHHIFEDQDLHRLGVDNRFPPYELQACVLIPKAAHTKRINSTLRIHNPTKLNAAASDLSRAYRDAYELIGDYCGGGKKLIQDELSRIVGAVLQLAAFRQSTRRFS
jgi:hypothetical protein